MASATSTHVELDKLTERAERFLRDYYHEAISELAVNDEPALYIEYKDLVQFDPDFADDYLTHSDLLNGALRKALQNHDLPVVSDFSETAVRLTDNEGVLDRLRVTELHADHLGEFVAVEGQLSKVTGLTYRFEEAAFQHTACPAIQRLPQGRHYFHRPNYCEGCSTSNANFTVLTDESTLIDQRKLKLETPPEGRVSGGGESVTVFAERDLCHHGGENGLADRAGERVAILGKFEGKTPTGKGKSSPEMDGHLVAGSVVFIEKKLDDITVNETKAEFQRLAAGEEGHPVKLLKDSLVPRIERTEQLDRILEAAVAWLFNSYRIDRPGGDQIRGDLHMALIGDPSTAKSTILADLARIAPKSVFRSGGSISKVGLTAAAQQEEFAGKTEWTLEPGVLPRANGGHCLIDEVDEVLDERSKAIHDALEGEQMVKVDKAGISADLPTRTALCISGNPKEGRFDPYAPIEEQVDMDPALISRMDVLLPVTDDLDPDIDARIADTILESYDELSRAEVATRRGEEPPDPDKTKRPVPIDVFRDWVHYARENCFPILSEDAHDLLRQTYLDIRNLNGGYDGGNNDDPIPATSRVLEAAIRLSTAFARVELTDRVRVDHVERARSILKTTIGMNFDPETGSFDADLNSSIATPKSQRDRIKSMHDLIREYQGDYQDGIPYHELMDLAEEAGINREHAEHAFEKMRSRGEVYEPATDRWRAT